MPGKQNRATRVIVTVVAMGLTAIAAPSAAGAAQGPSRAPEEQTFVQELVPTESAADILMSTKAVPEGADLAVTPPMGGCHDERVSGHVQYTYLNGVLATTETPFSSHIFCHQNAPGETMAHLSDQAELYVDDKRRELGVLSQCSNSDPSQLPCLRAFSAGRNLCAGAANCAGSYQAIHTYSMLLPPGWIWSEWPSRCQRLGESELLCNSTTKPVYIPPVM